ncbi:MAG: SagB family peptide dehydrogenase [Rhodomicrobium sp.]
MRSPGTKSQAKVPPSGISARLSNGVTLEAHSNGTIVANAGGDWIGLGTFAAAVAGRAEELRTGLPLSSFASASQSIGKEIDLLVRRLAAQGLVEYRIGRPQNGADDLIVIEPQVPGYWPQTPKLDEDGTFVLSRFAYLRRRDKEMVLESPRAGALFRICDPKLVSFVAMLSTPHRLGELRREDDFPGEEFLALLLDCQILFTIETPGESNLRLIEGDQDLALWDFHDFLFHTRSTEGRHANPLGGTYPHRGLIPPLPEMRPPWPGEKIDLCTFPAPRPEAMPVAKLLRERHSTRNFNDRQPITLPELSQFLDGAARALPRPDSAAGSGDRGPSGPVPPYPSAGASYELEPYLAVNICEGLPRGFYHYDARAHGLVPVKFPANELKALLERSSQMMGASAAPQVLMMIAARFGRISWKYSSVAYSLVLKDVGVLTQTLYLMAAGMGLGACAIGIANIEQFAKLTGIECHVEGPVGQFALGRPASRGSE